MTNADVLVLARSKRSKWTWSGYIERALNRRGVNAYRVTPNAVPLARVENAKLIINYGTGTTPIWWDRVQPDCVVLNAPEQVSISAHKTRMMHAIRTACPDNTLDYTVCKIQAQRHIDNDEVIVARTLLTSHSGRGIVLSPPNPLPDADLYTVLKRRRGLREYRVFMYDGKYVDAVQKKRKGREKLLEMGVAYSDLDTWWSKRERQVIRCWDNGWAFCHGNMDVTDEGVFADIAAAASKILTWGCVDVLIDSNTHDWYIVETNSAPGLDAGNTQQLFIDLFVNTYNGLINPCKEVL